MTRDRLDCVLRLANAGFNRLDAENLRRIAMTLHRWTVMQYDGGGELRRDKKTNKPYWRNANARYLDPHDPRAWRAIPDRESGALRRLRAIMAKYPAWESYVQTDPRGLPLYVVRKSEIPAARTIEHVYSTRGIGIGKEA